MQMPKTIYRWAIEAAESLFLARNGRLDFQFYRDAVTVMELAEANTQNSWDLHEQATECLAQLLHVLGDAPAATAARRSHVHVLVAEAERQSLHLLRVDFYTRARDLLADLGTDRTLLDELTRKVEQETHAVVSMGEFKPIPVEATGPIETIRSCLIGSDATRTLHNIALLPVFPNDVKELDAEVREARRQAPLAHSIPHLVVRQGRPAYRSEAADDWSDYIRHLGFRWHIYGLAVASVVEEGLTQGWLSGEHIMRFVESGEIIPRAKHPFLHRAVDALCRRDYVTVIHLLVPHLEDTLRSCTGLLGKPTSSMRGDVAQAKPLPDVLDDDRLNWLLGSGVVAGLKVLLTEQGGGNLRHDVAHGLITSEQCGPDAVGAVLWAFLRLALYRL